MAIKKKNKAQPATKLISKTGVRISYSHVFVPTSVHPDNPEKAYSVNLLLDKVKDKELIKEIKRCIQAATEEGIEKLTKWNGKKPVNLRSPLRDGDEEKEDELYAGHYWLQPKSKVKPGIVDKDNEPLTTDDEFYSGCWAQFSVKFFPYAQAGNKGVGVQLNHLRKTKDGERLGGRASVDEDFSDNWEDDEDEDEDDDDLMS